MIRVATIALLAVLVTPATAAAQLSLGAQVAVGGATITAPNDEPGEPTLLFGTSLTGPSFGGALDLDYRAIPFLSVGAELGVFRSSMEGFAENGATTRTLTLKSTSLEILVRARVEAPLTIVRPFIGVALGGRFGVSAAAVDERTGFSSDEPAPAIATANSFVVAGDLGVIFHAGPVEIPLFFRGARNASYGTTTQDRLEGYQSLSEPGSFVVDANWTYGFRLGARYVF
ncbi:MAG: hypothetical protein ACJAYU_003208 [Bradymonadia bacterium]